MSISKLRAGILVGCMGLATAGGLLAEPGAPDSKLPALPKPTANSAAEPLAKSFSLARAGEFLDAASMAWLQKNDCAACHTSYPHVLAGPALGGKPSPALTAMRRFLENRVANWDRGQPGDRPEPGAEGVTEVVATAATLAFNDAQTTGKLQPLTRQALNRMWTVQQADGAWDWNKHRLPPLEHDDYFGAVYAAVGVGMAPDGYARSDDAKAGLAKLRAYFAKHRPPDLHHQAWLLLAASKLDGLLTAERRAETTKDLLALQRPDGGWNLASLGAWQRHDGAENDKAGPSDGYATGLILYVLRQAAGLPAHDGRVQKGVAWLKGNQRESGRWFTRSPSADRAHYLTNAGTALAIMALQACEPAAPGKASP